MHFKHHKHLKCTFFTIYGVQDTQAMEWLYNSAHIRSARLSKILKLWGSYITVHLHGFASYLVAYY